MPRGCSLREVNKKVFNLCLLIAYIGVLFSYPSTALSIECNECHGTKNPPDFRPVDSPFRNFTTGGFKGNHRNHVSEVNSILQCEYCHAGSSSYGPSHRNGNISLSAHIKNSPLATTYNNTTTPWQQTTSPAYGTCTNVNCHFENETPQWGSTPFTVPGDCSKCHGFPPSGGLTGAEGSHKATGHLMGGDRDACAFCHPAHNGFTHATSTHRPLSVVTRDPALIIAGTYNGPTNDYLPSQNNTFGKCTNLYCHSNGTSVASGQAFSNISSPLWGGSATCTSCHAFPPNYVTNSPKANSHKRHSEYEFTCARCHYSTTADNQTIRNWRKHVNKFYNISAQGERLSYSFASNGGTCSNSYCHSNGTSISTGVIPANLVKWGSTLSCASCHGNPPAYPNNAPKANSHAKHDSYDYSCSNCHLTTTIGDGSTISNPHYHVNNTYDVNSLFFRFSSARAGGTCFTIICHNDGTGVVTGQQSGFNATWGSVSACNICHGFPPEYPNGTPKANSHDKHGYNCSYCHYDTTVDGETIDPTKHANSVYNISPSPVYYPMSYTSINNVGSCVNTSCHPTGEGSRSWGAELNNPNDCDGCHESPPNTPSHKVHFTGTALQANYTSLSMAGSANAGYLFNCANCHPRELKYHNNGFVNIKLYDTAAPADSMKAKNPTNARYVKSGAKLYDNRNYPYYNGTCSNVYCHSYSAWKTPGVETCLDNYSTCGVAAKAALVQTRVYRDVTWNSSLPKNCTGCHANGPRSTYVDNYASTGNSHSWINNEYKEEGHFGKYAFTTDPVSCTFCHNGTVNQTNNWSRRAHTPTALDPYFTSMSSVPIANFSNHVNGKNDVIFDRTRTYAMYSSLTGGYPKHTTFYRMSSTTSYTAETKTCSNVSCHLGQTSVTWGTPYKAYKYKDGESYGCVKCHDAGHPLPPN